MNTLIYNDFKSDLTKLYHSFNKSEESNSNH